MLRFPAAASGRPFVTLTRTFFAQFFASESVASEIQLRRAYVWVFVMLLLPGLFLLVQVFPAYQIGAAVALARHQPERVTAQLDQIFLLVVTYSMVTTGLVALFVWDHLSFARRDAVVLGALPLRTVDIVGAKLAALAALLIGGSLAVNLMTAVPFAGTTATAGFAMLAGHFAACLVTNLAAAMFVFAALVTLRGTLALFTGERLAARLGALLQFLFVVGLLCFVIVVLDDGLTPSASAYFVHGAGTAMPMGWFVGLFEWLLGSRGPAVDLLAGRALGGTALATAGAVLVSAAGFARQMQQALASATPARPGRLARWLTRRAAGRGGPARAGSEFILLTLARSRTHQALVAVNLAIGVAMAAAVLSGRVQTVAALAHPRIALLWIPLLLAWWMVMGLRATFFVPSELPAAWTFRFHGPDPDPGYWSAVRAAMGALVIPPAVVLAFALLLPFVGWRIAAWHALVVAALTIILVELVAATIDFVPFTRAYRPGHAKLKSRWWLYVAGLFAFAYLPVRIEIPHLDSPRALIEMLVTFGLGAAALEWVGRRRAGRRSTGSPQDDEAAGDSELTVLDLTTIPSH